MSEMPKFWSLGFGIGFGVSWLIAIIAGGYFLMIAGLTETSNPIGAVFSSVGIMFLLSPVLVSVARWLWLLSKK
jgi:hypothetical protein